MSCDAECCILYTLIEVAMLWCYFMFTASQQVKIADTLSLEGESYHTNFIEHLVLHLCFNLLIVMRVEQTEHIEPRFSSECKKRWHMDTEECKQYWDECFNDPNVPKGLTELLSLDILDQLIDQLTKPKNKTCVFLCRS